MLTWATYDIFSVLCIPRSHPHTSRPVQSHSPPHHPQPQQRGQLEIYQGSYFQCQEKDMENAQIKFLE